MNINYVKVNKVTVVKVKFKEGQEKLDGWRHCILQYVYCTVFTKPFQNTVQYCNIDEYKECSTVLVHLVSL